jgi:hypothetical protein
MLLAASVEEMVAANVINYINNIIIQGIQT